MGCHYALSFFFPCLYFFDPTVPPLPANLCDLEVSPELPTLWNLKPHGTSNQQPLPLHSLTSASSSRSNHVIFKAVLILGSHCFTQFIDHSFKERLTAAARPRPARNPIPPSRQQAQAQAGPLPPSRASNAPRCQTPARVSASQKPGWCPVSANNMDHLVLEVKSRTANFTHTVQN